MKEEQHKKFSDLSTFKVGGGIARVLLVETKNEFVSTLKELQQSNTPYLIVGEGSNILPSDDTYDGVVVIPSYKGVAYEDMDTTTRVIADAGVKWDDLVKEVIEKNLWGLENLSGIPGLVGASPMQNIGAYGTDVSRTIEWVEVYDAQEKEVRTLSHDEVRFGYRTSFLKEERGRFAILRVSFLLSLEATPNLSYKDLRAFFAEDATPTLFEIRDAVLSIRATKFPNLSEYGTAGSFFTNPIVSKEEATRILSLFPEAVHYPEGGEVKFSLAWLLDNVLHVKGMKEGGAVVWHAQPLVLVAEKTATAKEVCVLAEKIALLVKEKVGIEIFPEVRVM